MTGHREQYIACGMDEYVAKPINTEHLFQTISKVLNTGEGRASIAQENVAIRSTLPVDTKNRSTRILSRVDGNVDLLLEIVSELYEKADRTVARPDAVRLKDIEELVDLPELISRVGGDVSLLSAMAEKFFDESPQLLERLTIAMGDNNRGDIINIAEAMKGIVGNLSARRAFVTAHRLATEGQNVDGEELQKMATEFLEQLSTMIPIFKAFKSKELKTGTNIY